MTIILYLIFYAVCALNIVWGLQKRKSNALCAGAFIVMFILIAFNFDGPDIGNYLETYASIGDAPNLHVALGSTYMESGYILLMFGANKLGLDFYAFRIVVTVVCFALIGSVIKFFKVNPNMIVGLYMAYLFFMDAIQFRNFAAMCIVVFSTKYLFQKTKRSYLQYLIGILAASFFHIIALVYLVLFIVKFMRSEKAIRILFCCAVGLFVICFVFRSLLIRAAYDVVDMLHRGSSYIQTAAEVRFNPFIALVLQLLAVYPLLRYGNKISDERARNKANFILSIEVVIMFLLPGSFINSNLNRIYRNLLILDTIGLALLYENTSRNTMAKQTACIAQFFTVGGWLAIDIYRNTAERIIDKLMKFNLFCMPTTANDIFVYIVVTFFSLLIVWTIKGLCGMRTGSPSSKQDTNDADHRRTTRKRGITV